MNFLNIFIEIVNIYEIKNVVFLYWPPKNWTFWGALQKLHFFFFTLKLIILAEVTIIAISRPNGILNQALKAKEKTEVPQTEDQIKLSVLEALSGGEGIIESTDSLDKA